MLTIEFPNDHDQPQDSQVLIAITGTTPEAIKEQLQDILYDIERYHKPIQGTSIYHNCTKTVYTPVWNKIIY